MNTLFGICWGIDALLALIAIYLFLTGIATATNGSWYFQAWLGLFIIIAIAVGGSLWIKWETVQTRLSGLLPAYPFF